MTQEDERIARKLLDLSSRSDRVQIRNGMTYLDGYALGNGTVELRSQVVRDRRMRMRAAEENAARYWYEISTYLFVSGYPFPPQEEPFLSGNLIAEMSSLDVLLGRAQNIQDENGASQVVENDVQRIEVVNTISNELSSSFFSKRFWLRAPEDVFTEQATASLDLNFQIQLNRAPMRHPSFFGTESSGILLQVNLVYGTIQDGAATINTVASRQLRIDWGADQTFNSLSETIELLNMVPP